jgi:hypothetical protein
MREALSSKFLRVGFIRNASGLACKAPRVLLWERTSARRRFSGPLTSLQRAGARCLLGTTPASVIR